MRLLCCGESAAGKPYYTDSEALRQVERRSFPERIEGPENGHEYGKGSMSQPLTIGVCGLGFVWQGDAWYTTRVFRPMLPVQQPDSHDGERRTVSLVGAPEMLEAFQPTVEQMASLQWFLHNESRLCARVLSAVVRYEKVMRKEHPGDFEDVEEASGFA